MITEATQHWPQVEVDYNEGLTVDYARRNGISTAVRGLRAVTDFEHEFSMALTNRSLWPDFDTVFLMTRVDYIPELICRAPGGSAGRRRQPVCPIDYRRAAQSKICLNR